MTHYLDGWRWYLAACLLAFSPWLGLRGLVLCLLAAAMVTLLGRVRKAAEVEKVEWPEGF
jgi:hypothetical protein